MFTLKNLRPRSGAPPPLLNLNNSKLLKFIMEDNVLKYFGRYCVHILSE